MFAHMPGNGHIQAWPCARVSSVFVFIRQISYGVGVKNCAWIVLTRRVLVYTLMHGRNSLLVDLWSWTYSILSFDEILPGHVK